MTEEQAYAAHGWPIAGWSPGMTEHHFVLPADGYGGDHYVATLCIECGGRGVLNDIAFDRVGDRCPLCNKRGVRKL